MTTKTVAVIVTYNRLEKLKICLEKTFQNAFYRVVVIDNNSSDGTSGWLDEHTDPRLVVLHSDRNLGGAGGFKMGFRYAAEQLLEADWLVCFDDDAYPDRALVARFEAMDVPESVGGIAGAVYLPDGNVSEMNRPSVNPFWHLKEFLLTPFRGRYGFHVTDMQYQDKEPWDIDASSFVGFFLRLDLIRSGRIGLPRAELFIYADDIIYVLELRKAGFRHWFAPALIFHHDCQTLVNQKDVYHPLWRVYYTFRNRLEMYRIASGMFYPLILLIKIPRFFMAVRHYEKSERVQFLRITRRAILDGVSRNYSMSHDEVVQLSSNSGG